MFERQSMEQLVNKMVSWTRGVTGRLTDFRVGSKIRTIYEATALIVEELYDRVYRSLKTLIEDNIYAVIGFEKLSATYASGEITLYRMEPADANYLIPAGTTVLSKATQYRAPISYRTTVDVIMATGAMDVKVPVVSMVAGLAGNVGAGEIDSFLVHPTGVDTVTNLTAISGGTAEETKEQQKTRFQLFIEANARGTLQSVKYGAMQATLEAEDGIVTERVQQAYVSEDLPARKGEVDVYIWNGVGVASEALKQRALLILNGYYEEDGSAVYGYKPAGNIANVYTSGIQYVSIQLFITPEAWTTTTGVKTVVEKAIDDYFGSLLLGQTLIQTELESRVKQVEGVQDVKLYVSIDSGATFTMNNVTVGKSTIIVSSKPIMYA